MSAFSTAQIRFVDLSVSGASLSLRPWPQHSVVGTTNSRTSLMIVCRKANAHHLAVAKPYDGRLPPEELIPVPNCFLLGPAESDAC